MLGVIYVSVNSKHYPTTIYKCVGESRVLLKAIYQVNETYVKVVNRCFNCYISTQKRRDMNHTLFGGIWAN